MRGCSAIMPPRKPGSSSSDSISRPRRVKVCSCRLLDRIASAGSPQYSRRSAAGPTNGQSRAGLSPFLITRPQGWAEELGDVTPDLLRTKPHNSLKDVPMKKILCLGLLLLAGGFALADGLKHRRVLHDCTCEPGYQWVEEVCYKDV